ncbi:ADP-ribosylglycohydrolase family protein [Caballeronia sordidicola]|uniref:ADP-ribosylglycohydrolase family protein n=1 Tax=Caballeronia sordidicola TaxID=196367 RepID=UPI0004D00A5B|nr:ADP-ribosylglycohydrolase family protein [Caballeronia sordidicola]
MSSNHQTLQDRVRGLLYGIAYGDALGSTVEQLSAQEIRELYGRVSSLDTESHRMAWGENDGKGCIRGNGIVTDDTLMVLCLMTVYNETGRHLDAWDMASGMVRQIAWTPRWVPELQRETMLMERLFHPQRWIFQRHQLTSCDPRQGGIGNMVNCGAAMYIAPVGVVNAGDPHGAYEEAIAFASGHQESYGLEAAGVFASAIAAALIPGTTIEQVIEAAISVAKDGTRAAIAAIADAAIRLRGERYDRIVAEFHWIISRFSPMGDDVQLTEGKTAVAIDGYRPSRRLSIEELPLALGFALINDGDFNRTIEDGINSGRDTGSIGVMAGAVLGAMHGAKVIDAGVCDKLDQTNRMNLLNAADHFTQTVRAIHDADRARDAWKSRVRDKLALDAQLAR